MDKLWNTDEMRFLKAALEFIVFIILAVLNYCLRYNPTVRFEWDMVNISNVYLSCDTSKLMYDWAHPYFDYESSSNQLPLNYELPESVFFICAIITPILIFAVVEWIKLAIKQKLGTSGKTSKHKMPMQLLGKASKVTGIFLIGASTAGLLAAIIKLNFVSPRPHFISVCQTPSQILISNCSGNSFWMVQPGCSQKIEKDDLREALRAFPSYHSTLAIYCGVFTLLYLFRNNSYRLHSSVSPALLLTLGTMMMIGATHRISTGYSTVWDIVAGALLGAAVATIMIELMMPKRGLSKLRAEARSKRKISRMKEIEHESTDSDEVSDSFASKTTDNYGISRQEVDHSPAQAVNRAFKGSNDSLYPRNRHMGLDLKRFSYTNGGTIYEDQTDGFQDLSVSPSKRYDLPRQRNSAPSANFYTASNDRSMKDFQTPKGQIKPIDDPPRISLNKNDNEAASYF